MKVLFPFSRFYNGGVKMGSFDRFAGNDFADDQVGGAGTGFNALYLKAGTGHPGGEFFGADAGKIHIFPEPFIT